MAFDKQWFTDRIGQTVIRTNNYDGREVEFEVTKDNVGYLWLFTEKGFTYRDSAVIAQTETVSKMETDDSWLEAARPQFRIHKAPTGCLACEA